MSEGLRILNLKASNFMNLGFVEIELEKQDKCALIPASKNGVSIHG